MLKAKSGRLNMPAAAETRPLLKEQLASQLREAIMQGRIDLGQRVVESAWARECGVAQASVREAINLLIIEGFLVKSAGRSARVPLYTQRDIVQIYEVRAALEGMAAQLAAAARTDVRPLEAALEQMEAAVARSDVKALVDSDLAFHLALADASGNPLLAEMLGRVLRPLFTFVLLRMMKTHADPQIWQPDLPRHREMIYLIRESSPAVAGQFVQHCVACFAARARSVWLPEPKPKRARSRS
jgi:DNA-binding GntR family transcriptional regulator